MSITQTVEIPASHRLTIEVPPEIPAGSAVVTLDFKPVAADPDWFENGGECPLCAGYKKPNAKLLAAIDEGEAILRGEIPAKRYNSLTEMLEDLDN